MNAEMIAAQRILKLITPAQALPSLAPLGALALGEPEPEAAERAELAAWLQIAAIASWPSHGIRELESPLSD